MGGAIRDTILGKSVEDWDLATLATPEQIKRIFPRTVPIGIEHGTVGVIGNDGTLYEVTTFRKDIEHFGRHAVVEFSRSIEEDLARRDFTLNAMAWNPGTGVILDPFEGRKHLEAKMLKTVRSAKDRFSEDLLRVLRALRFAGQFDLEIEEATSDALLRAVPRLHQLSSERIQEEMMKILSKAKMPSRALNHYGISGVIAKLYPELCNGNTNFDLQKSGFIRSTLACDEINMDRPLLRLAVLLSSMGSHGNGDLKNIRSLVENMMQRLRFSKADTKRTVRIVWGFLQENPGRNPQECRCWLNGIGPDLFNDICRMWIAYARVDGSGASKQSGDVLSRIRFIRKVLQSHPPLTLDDLAVDGNDLQELGLQPGPTLGAILQELLAKVLMDPDLNNFERLTHLAKEVGKRK